MSGKLYNGVVSTLGALTIPDFRQFESGYYDYIYFGGDNLLPSYMASLVELSPTHSAILESKANFINSELKIEMDDGIVDKLNYENIDTLGGTMENLIDLASVDLATYETIYLEVIYNERKTRIVGLNKIPYEYVRIQKQTNKGEVKKIYVSPDWSRHYLKKNKPRTIDVFNPNKINSKTQVIIERRRRPAQPYYTIPTWFSAIQWILLEDDIAELNRNDVTNGFFPSLIMNFFNGEPSEKDKQELETYINSKFKGGAGAKLMLFFSNNVDKKVQLDTFEKPNLGDYTTKLLPLVREQILSAHRTPAGLIGISTGSGFSNKAEELEAGYQLYIKSAIVPLQKLFINALKKVYIFNKIDAKISFKNELLDMEQEQNGDAEVSDERDVKDANINTVDNEE